MKPYSTDLREAVLHALGTGAAVTEVARLFGVSRRSVKRWAARAQTSGSVAATPRTGPACKLDAAALAVLHQRVRDHPDATLNEHRAALAALTAIQVSEATLSRAMARLGITHKKRV